MRKSCSNACEIEDCILQSLQLNRFPCPVVFLWMQSQSVFDSDCNLTFPTNNTDCLDADHQSFTFEGGNGPTTGNCVPVADGTGQCEIRAWCDVENENDNIRSDAHECTIA